MKKIARNSVLELEFTSTSDKHGSDADNIELNLTLTTPDKREISMPAFWAGDKIWRARISSDTIGLHSYKTLCSDPTDSGLHGQTGQYNVIESQEKNPLLQHGKLQVKSGTKLLEHRDGTPFFWLGDTWWMGFTNRLHWPDEFQLLTTDRVQKGFTLIQIVAGLYPDMPPFDERGMNEAGYPWNDKKFEHLNPAYWDMVDRRVKHLVDSGLVPCIVGEWGFYLSFTNVTVLKKHWRYIIARYGAYPVVWCIAGEAMMKWYLEPNLSKPQRAQRLLDWSALATFIRSTDGFHNPITVHPTQYGHEQLSQPALLDINMLQTGHASPVSELKVVTNTVRMIQNANKQKFPVVVGEVNYEGIFEANHQHIQRCLFWAIFLSGGAGYTYGANGIWQLNRKERPFGPSPYGNNWGETPWSEAYQCLGSKHVGIGKEILSQLTWTQLVPHPEWVKGDFLYAAQLSPNTRLFYKLIPGRFTIQKLEKGAKYTPIWINPLNGKRYPLDPILADKKGNWTAPNPPLYHDWVLLLERTP